MTDLLCSTSLTKETKNFFKGSKIFDTKNYFANVAKLEVIMKDTQLHITIIIDFIIQCMISKGGGTFTDNGGGSYSNYNNPKQMICS